MDPVRTGKLYYGSAGFQVLTESHSGALSAPTFHYVHLLCSDGRLSLWTCLIIDRIVFSPRITGVFKETRWSQ